MIDDMSGWFKFTPHVDIDNPNETLGQAIPILDLLDKFGIEYMATGQNQYKTLCLWHDDSHPSLYIYAATHSYHCFSCQANGGVVELMAKMMGHTGTPGTLGFNLATDELAKMAGLTTGASLVQFTPAPKRKPEETIEYYAIRAGNEIRKYLKTKEGKRGYDTWVAWADTRFKRLDSMLDILKDEDWERAKKCYDATLNKIRGGK